jgi:hypothetical protein
VVRESSAAFTMSLSCSTEVAPSIGMEVTPGVARRLYTSLGGGSASMSASASDVGMGFALSMPTNAKPEASNARIVRVTALAETVSAAIAMGARCSSVDATADGSSTACVALAAT